MKSFFNSRCGRRKLFNWIDEEQTLHVVRFNQDEIAIKQKLQFDSNGNICIAGYSAEVVLIKVYSNLERYANGGTSDSNYSTILDGGNASGI